MSCTGDDILILFKKLDINIGNLDPNVIRGWFDTDDENLKDLLNWICISFDETNVLAPQEQEEFEQLPRVLTGEEYEESVSRFEKQYEGIFDVASTKLEIELLEDERNFLVNDCEHQENIIRINKEIHKELRAEISELSKEEIEAKIELEAAEAECLKLAQELDENNTKIYNQMERYASYLHDFEFATDPVFVNNMPLDKEKESIDFISSYLNVIVNKQKQDTSTGYSFIESIDPAELSNHQLITMRNRLFCSNKNLILQRLEHEQLTSVLGFLKNYTVASVPNEIESDQIELNVEAKADLFSVMLKSLDVACANYADAQVAAPKLCGLIKELETCREKLQSLDALKSSVGKLLAHFVIVSILHSEEQNDINYSHKFFSQVVNYIRKNLQGCMLRTEAMDNIIAQFGLYNSRPLTKKWKLLETVCATLSDTGEDDKSLADAVMSYEALKYEIASLENRYVHGDFVKHKKETKEIMKSVRVLEKFLISGPTGRVVVIPREIHSYLTETESHLENQKVSIESVVERSAKALEAVTNKSNKWSNLRRRLWMDFLVDPEKMFSAIRSIEEEYNNKTNVEK